MLWGRKLIYNTALLTVSSLVMSAISMAFQVWLVGRIGSAGIGLYQLVMSVTGLAMTFAISGIRFASTRLISEELGADTGAVTPAMKNCLGYALFFGSAAGLILYFTAEPVGFLWVGDARTVLSLKISALSMPCGALCASMSGYFTATGRVWKPTLVHFAEQLMTIGLMALFLDRAPAGDIEKCCTAVTLGRVTADILSLLLMTLVFLNDTARHCSKRSEGVSLTSRMLRIAVPLAVSAYARSALSTVQHLFVPRGLKSAGFSADKALSGYGVIQGMALPVIFFPSCIMGAVSELAVPKLTESQVRSEEGISDGIDRLFSFSAWFSVSVSVFMLIFADVIGMKIYKSAEAGYYIRLLAPLIPVMYIDMTVDGCLKGLGQQMWCMGINILDALSGVLLVWWLLPKYALSAYIAIIYATEILNFLLSYFRLNRVA
ncbi:MAG: oligosaccharide flippase family protein [Eubacteriales bacterium]|nr:oligosaccharide flippase family protein [Eubacteriales bacterium]